MVGCQGTKELQKIPPKQHKQSSSMLYKLSIDNNSNVYLHRLKPKSYKKELLLGFAHKKWGKLLFKINGKSEVDIEIPKKISQKKLIIIYNLISKKGNSEKLLGEFKIYVRKEKKPQFNFIKYSSLTNNEIERYNNSKKTKEELTHSHNWSKAWDICGGYIALKRDGSLYQFGELNQCDWGEIDFMDSRFVKRNIYTYILKPKKIATGFHNAKFINSGFSFYIIRKDGTLWTKGYDTPFKQVGKDSNWLTVGVDTGVHDGLDYDIGLKKDGSLWNISNEKPISLSRYKGWEKVWIDCSRVYAQKKDGVPWSKYTYKEDFKKVDNDKVQEIVKRMKKIPSGEIIFAKYTEKINVNKNGTLWLPPKIDTEEVQKNKAITVHPNHRQVISLPQKERIIK